MRIMIVLNHGTDLSEHNYSGTQLYNMGVKKLSRGSI